MQLIFGLKADGVVGKETTDLLAKLDKVTHFKLDEFRCKHCGVLKLNINLLLKLEELRKQTGPLTITSGYRCLFWNKKVGGIKNSEHLKGNAADIKAVNMNPNKVHFIADKVFNNGGVGKYNTFTHVDVGVNRYRW